MNQTTIKERPILFSGEMVRAILEGRKTQTRRIMKPQPSSAPHIPEIQHREKSTAIWPCETHPGQDYFAVCPYGLVGDRLWVRECWSQNNEQISDSVMDTRVVYRATSGRPATDNGVSKPWRPSSHMPRWASRITLEITGIRVERLQAISYRDCLAEGCPPVPCYDDAPEPETILAAIQGNYQSRWESTNGPGSWNANPWVWVLTFKRLTPGNPPA